MENVLDNDQSKKTKITALGCFFYIEWLQNYMYKHVFCLDFLIKMY